MSKTLMSFARTSALVVWLVALAAIVLTPELASAAAKSVTIKSSCKSSSFCFAPSSLSAKSGDKVTWTNGTQATHTVTRCTPSACNGKSGGTGKQSGPSSSSIAPSGTFSKTFTKSGSYLYYCKIHGYSVMHGTLNVAASRAAPTPPPTKKPALTPAPAAAPASATAAPKLPATGTDATALALGGVTLTEAGLALMLFAAAASPPTVVQEG